VKGSEQQPPHGRVSVIIPTRDRPALLREAVESLLRQTRPATEIIVVDDGSRAENFPEIDDIGRMHASISIFKLPENSGVTAARNFGLERASGNFVVFFDDDDLLHPRALELNEDFFAAHPASDIVICRSRMFLTAESAPNCAPEQHPSCRPAKFWLIDQFDGKRLERNPIREILRFAVPINAIMFRRKCLGTSAFQVDLRMGEDRLLLLNLARRGCRFAFHPTILSFIRIHAGNAQTEPAAARAPIPYLLSLLSGDMLTTNHDRFICHARLLQIFQYLHDRSLWPHLRFLLRFPHLFLFYTSWYMIIQFKKKKRRRHLALTAVPETEERKRS